MRRTIFGDEHQALRETFGAYLDREVAPVYDDWERAGLIPRDVLKQWGRLGFLGPAVPAEYGGAGADDFRFNTVLLEEAAHRELGVVVLALEDAHPS